MIFTALVVSLSAAIAQQDTTQIYQDRKDTLQTAVFTASQNSNYLSKSMNVRTEVISAAGLCKMACCNLAESFENSASVTVGYSDAVTGARQIRLLGQSGIYTQMLDENRPVMRGLAAPWGLNFIPGQWLQSIQIAKGATSVINGVESMTGQINMEHRKPTDEKPLYVQASVMNDTKADLNVISSLQLDDEGKWSTVILSHVDGNFKTMDHNNDGFMDDPKALNIALSNRWLYFNPDGVQVRFGVRGIWDRRNGGQTENPVSSAFLWKSNIMNRSIGGYVKVGYPLSNEGDGSSVAVVADYTAQSLGSNFGLRTYDATQHSLFANLLYQNNTNESHHYTFGLSNMFDCYNETIFNNAAGVRLNNLGAFAEYTYHHGDEFSAIAGVRGEWYNKAGFRVSPRLTIKWAPVKQLVIRANGGRGLRYSTPIVDNIGVMSTSKDIKGNYLEHPLEDSWTVGGNATWYLPFDEKEKTYLSLDFFHTAFKEQMLVDYTDATTPGGPAICFYNLSSLSNGKSYTNNIQLDFSSELFKGFTLTLTGRYTDARQSLTYQADDTKPMTSQFKGVLNLQYATNLSKWIFDFTASVNGPCKVWDFMRSTDKAYATGYTSTYPLLYAQVTRRFKGFDLYIGGENLTNYTQPNPIIGAANPFDKNFDASCVWGPLMGVKVYAGFRMTIWKHE